MLIKVLKRSLDRSIPRVTLEWLWLVVLAEVLSRWLSPPLEDGEDSFRRMEFKIAGRAPRADEAVESAFSSSNLVSL